MSRIVPSIVKQEFAFTNHFLTQTWRVDSIIREDFQQDPFTNKIRKCYAVKYSAMVLPSADVSLMTRDDIDWLRWVKTLDRLPDDQFYVKWKIDLEWASNLEGTKAEYVFFAQKQCFRF